MIVIQITKVLLVIDVYMRRALLEKYGIVEQMHQIGNSNLDTWLTGNVGVIQPL